MRSYAPAGDLTQDQLQLLYDTEAVDAAVIAAGAPDAATQQSDPNALANFALATQRRGQRQDPSTGYQAYKANRLSGARAAYVGSPSIAPVVAQPTGMSTGKKVTLTILAVAVTGTAVYIASDMRNMSDKSGKTMSLPEYFKLKKEQAKKTFKRR